MRLFSFLPLLTTLLVASAPAFAQQAQLGVQVAPSDAGPRVETVLPRSAASILGLIPGDVLLAVDEQALTTPESLVYAIRAHRPGDIVNLKVQRQGVTFELLGVLARAQREVRGDAPPSMGQQLRGQLRGMGDDIHHQLQEIDLEGLPEEIRQQFERGVQRMPEMPDMHGFVRDFAREMGRFGRSFDGFGQDFSFDFDLFGGNDTEMVTETWLTYPESTPPGDREALIADAKKTYGDDVQIEFKGSVTMMRSSTRSVQKSESADSDAPTEHKDQGPSRMELIQAAAEEQVENLRKQLSELENWLESRE